MSDAWFRQLPRSIQPEYIVPSCSRAAGYAVVSVIRRVLIMGVGITALWARAMTIQILGIVLMTLLAVSLLIPVSRPRPNR